MFAEKLITCEAWEWYPPVLGCFPAVGSGSLLKIEEKINAVKD